MPEIDPGRLLGDLRALAKFGAYKTGVHRPTFSREDVEARHWFADRLHRGRARRHDRRHRQHLRHQPRAGREGAHRLASREPEPCRLARRPARRRLRPRGRARACRGPGDRRSRRRRRGLVRRGGAFRLVPRLALVHRPALRGRDRQGANRYDGTPLREALDKAAAFRPAAPAVRGRSATRAIVEAHIEQGDTLEGGDAQDRRRHGDRRDLAVPPHGDGRAEPRRHDRAWRAAATPGSRSCGSWARSTSASPGSAGPRTVWTCGRITLEPGAPSIIPGRAEALLQFRDADAAVLERLQAELQRLVEEANRDGPLPDRDRGHVASRRRRSWTSGLQAAIDGGGRGAHARARHMRMPSGAGHDAQWLARKHAGRDDVRALDRRHQPSLDREHRRRGHRARRAGVLRRRRADAAPLTPVRPAPDLPAGSPRR